MCSTFIFRFVVLFLICVGNVLGHSRGADYSDVVARGLLNIVDEMALEARQWQFYDWLERREQLEDLTTRELYEELNRRVVIASGGPKETKMRCDVCKQMIPTMDIVVSSMSVYIRYI
ncbi:hypothetical protein FA15DRAFT_224857 [Coprinopsis marcescibilis]|uniref:Uncharacterized protein n=1 Tax=Coprinopsis marcescibilis TaxID=230819 RepID=A0A5C3KFU2_COPMA|nr:hypothetical protein FA15DRAFT_224857 [Coprinopsis marcescibilis]